MLATVFVPEGKLDHFVKQITTYMEKDTDKGLPLRQKLVESIADIKMAVLDSLWTDTIDLPAEGEEIWWEVWLRTGDDRHGITSFFREQGERIGLVPKEKELKFPDRTVLLARGTKEQMSRSAKLLNCIAELRKAQVTSTFYTSMTPVEQSEWMNDAIERTTAPDTDAPAVCILDTGINRQHPMLEDALTPEDMHTYDPAWGVDDRRGHGTEMAGLALYGDLTDALSTSEEIKLRYRLESVKILHNEHSNEPDLYGEITTEAVYRAEGAAPARKRVICMAVSAPDGRDRGRPSSWSASLDTLSAGAEDDLQRLIIVAAGNTDKEFRHLFPTSNMSDTVHDPGQAWNALTVGAYTEKTTIEKDGYPGWTVISPYGDLGPSSCTSMDWQRIWPIKPDIVMEGGNMAIDPDTGKADWVDDLSLLTTHNRFTEKPFVVTYDTSPATAIISGMATSLHAEYPNYWPETVRALLVHSAEWTEEMLAKFPFTISGNKQTLLRYCGYGVPDMNRAMWSASNSLTLIVQDSLQPFDKDGSTPKSRDMHLHTIPWPEDILMDLGETLVEMRVTLSYFIEPSPGQRGWTRKYSYASHGLRFDVKTPEERLDEFRRRINQAAHDEERGSTSSSDSNRWQLGVRLRVHGSIHSDRWQGTAAELAQRGHIAVYPVIGWWRERHHLGRWNKQARYSLVVTIKTPETEMDIYTPVENQIKTVIEV